MVWEYGMLSVEDMAAVKVAIEICNNPKLKRWIICVPDDVNEEGHQYDRKRQWNEIIEKKGTIMLRHLGLPEKLLKIVLGFVLAIGARMLAWAEYYEGTFGFSRLYSINFLNNSFFTQQGIIDSKKAAEELMSDKDLSIEQRYKLACLYCFTDHIDALYRQMTKEDKKKFYNSYMPGRVKQPGLVKFWSYYLMGKVDKITGEKTLDRYRLEKAVQSGSIAAVEYCLERTNLRREKDAVVDAAVEAVRNRIRKDNSFRYDNRWVPGDYYTDILCFLLSRMKEDQQIVFLKTDIKGSKYTIEHFKDQKRSRVLEYFLGWPYQDYFTKTAKLMWEFLPKNNYAVLLLKICDKIELQSQKYGEEKSYDYRGILKEFWRQSPERYKKYIFSNQEIVYSYDRAAEKAGSGLLSKLLTLKNFTYEDRKNIELILASASDEEKEIITSPKEWRNVCIELMKEQKWEVLDRFALNCFLSKEEFKRALIFTEEAKRVCIEFVKNNKWDAAESFVKWSALPGKETDRLKKEIIDSEDGRYACVDLISYDKKIETFDKFAMWCFPSEEEVKAFKKELVFSCEGMFNCADLVSDDQLGLVNEFINFGLSSEKEIKELKKNVAYRTGSSVCERLISDYLVEAICDEESLYTIGHTTKFKGGKWEEVEKFVTWCFSSEEEISDFKKNRLLEMCGVDIHFNLISCNQWEEAETFFAWLGLSTKEISKLKKETLLSGLGMEEINKSLHDSNLEHFLGYAWGKWEKLELYLRWCLTDKEAVLEFKDRFDDVYGFRSYANEGETIPENKRIILNEFYLLIEELLSNFSPNSEETKRQSEILAKEFPNKRLCDMKFGNRGAEYGK